MIQWSAAALRCMGGKRWGRVGEKYGGSVGDEGKDGEKRVVDVDVGCGWGKRWGGGKGGMGTKSKIYR